MRNPTAWSLIALALCTLLLGMLFPHRPGLYLDAVNPDYLAVKILHPSVINTIWVLPGNLIFGRFPILAGSIYHGSLQAYLAAPFAWLFGPSMPTLRLEYSVEAWAVCCAVFALVRSASGSRALAAFGALLLAADPAFAFAFRTQANLVTFPICFTLCGCLLLIRPQDAAGRRLMGNHMAAGVLFGLAAWGYFVHLFVLPGTAIFLLTRRGADWRRRLRRLAAFGAGVFAGLLPYVAGYVLIWHAMGSLADTVAWFRVFISSLHIGVAESPAARIGAMLDAAASAWTGDWIWGVVWGVWHTDYGQVAKLAVLLAAPVLAWAFARRDQPAWLAFRLALYALVSALCGDAVFGSRLGGHHFQMLLPLLYVLLALSAGMLAGAHALRLRPRWLAALGTAMFLVNLAGSAWDLEQLRTVEGAGFYSNPIGEYPLAALADADRTPLIYMDWGGLMPFTYLTGGQIPAYGRDEITGYGRVSVLDPLRRLGPARLAFLGEGAFVRGQATLAGLHLAARATRVLHDHTGRFDYAIFSVAP